MKPSLISSLVLMCALGAGMFAVMIALRQVRVGRPVPGSRQEIAIVGGNPAASVAKGIQSSLMAAETALANQRQTDGVQALDAAMRAASVARDAFESAGGVLAFGITCQTIMQARIAIQNHDDVHAARLIESAIAALPTALPDPPPLPADPGAYAGSTLINAQGAQVGELCRADGHSAVLALGGRYDLLGFLDLGGTPVRVDTARLLFGKKRTLGNTYVVLQAAAADPNALGATRRSPHR